MALRYRSSTDGNVNTLFLHLLGECSEPPSISKISPRSFEVVGRQICESPVSCHTFVFLDTGRTSCLCECRRSIQESRSNITPVWIRKTAKLHYKEEGATSDKHQTKDIDAPPSLNVHDASFESNYWWNIIIVSVSLADVAAMACTVTSECGHKMFG